MYRTEKKKKKNGTRDFNMKQECSIDHNLDSIFLRQATGREPSLSLTRSINVLPIGIGSIKTVLEKKKKRNNEFDRQGIVSL